MALVKTWPLELQHSVDIRDPEHLLTLGTRILEERLDYLRPLIQPVLEERAPYAYFFHAGALLQREYRQ